MSEQLALILVGAACVIAAIVGGGVKFQSMEVGSIQSLRRQILLGGFGLIILLVGLAWNLSAGDAQDENTAAAADAANAAANEAEPAAAADATGAAQDNAAEATNAEAANTETSEQAPAEGGSGQ